MSIRKFKEGIALEGLSTDPTSPIEGQLQFADGSVRAKGYWQYKDSAWSEFGSGSGGGGGLIKKSVDITTATTGTFNTLNPGDPIITARFWDNSLGEFQEISPASLDLDINTLGNSISYDTTTFTFDTSDYIQLNVFYSASASETTEYDSGWITVSAINDTPSAGFHRVNLSTDFTDIPAGYTLMIDDGVSIFPADVASRFVFDDLAGVQRIAVDTTSLAGTDKFRIRASASTLPTVALSGILLDEDDMVSDSNEKGATQQSIKAFVEAKISSPTLLQNVGLDVTVSGGAATITLKQRDGSSNPTSASPCKIGFRNITSTIGGYDVLDVTSAITLTIDSGATLGSIDGVSHKAYVYAYNDSGTVKLAISSIQFEEHSLQAITLLDYSADDSYTLYADTAETSVPIKLIGSFDHIQTTAGTWASAPSQVYIGDNVVKSTFNGVYRNCSQFGSTNSYIPYFEDPISERAVGPRSLISVTRNTTNGTIFTANAPIEVDIHLGFEWSGTGEYMGFSLNASTGQTQSAINTITADNAIMVGGSNGGNQMTGLSTSVFMKPGDELRPHAGALYASSVSGTTHWRLSIKVREI